MVLQLKKNETFKRLSSGYAIDRKGEELFVEIITTKWHKYMPDSDQFKLGDMVFGFHHLFRLKYADTMNDPKYSKYEVEHIGKASPENILNTINKIIGSNYNKLEYVDGFDFTNEKK
jgi:hypothetical protein